MLATQTAELLQHLRRGHPDQADFEFLERVNAKDWVAELRTDYPLIFQERHLNRKWEISMARTMRPELIPFSKSNSLIVSFVIVPVYVNCLMLNIEGDRITGVSRLNRLAVRAVTKPFTGLAIQTSIGLKLDLTPDGWSVKPLRRRTVRLSESFLKARGWHFDHLSHFIPRA
jgi:hypothetical protein